jgi:hypothetical protein
MECPHCRGRVEHPVTTLRRQRKAEHRCIWCGTPKVGADLLMDSCEDCRHIRKIKRAAWENARRRGNTVFTPLQ